MADTKRTNAVQNVGVVDGKKYEKMVGVPLTPKDRSTYDTDAGKRKPAPDTSTVR
jgi:hypothetical protein